MSLYLYLFKFTRMTKTLWYQLFNVPFWMSLTCGGCPLCAALCLPQMAPFPGGGVTLFKSKEWCEHSLPSASWCPLLPDCECFRSSFLKLQLPWFPLHNGLYPCTVSPNKPPTPWLPWSWQFITTTGKEAETDVSSQKAPNWSIQPLISSVCDEELFPYFIRVESWLRADQTKQLWYL